MSAAPADSEWQVGWRIVLACAVANGTGIALLFYCFSLFLIPMSTDLGLTRTDTGIVQSLIITAVLGAPVIGRLTDLFGFRPVFVVCTLVLVLIGARLIQPRRASSVATPAATASAPGAPGSAPRR